MLAAEVLLSGDVQELDRGLDSPGRRDVRHPWGPPLRGGAAGGRPWRTRPSPCRGGGIHRRRSGHRQDRTRGGGQPLVCTMANEAFLADAQRLYAVVPEDDVPRA
ncbi:hypothetical protein QJS66_16860 [Kocuria rhizophila]|nr:hypothetical protein QJS66_16860 [Kocuria rhizophila]